MPRNKKKTENKSPVVAPGMYDFLEQDATPEEIKRGEFTRVTMLSYDETH
ncbi:hypothetical protein SAMN02745133_00685 [Desulforamulus putei DSM 12395]|uniref:Uncharacterized protein n=1 Tax=Desulforamulus putei DSM 12395 TaxID=1121429 RepID=A0A1M4ULH6_9FIRM|nr:hypothetical protein [Desulforamulus putei]SHE57433.1 hypothetical protein SAMN02745133_00685 [Desulforamulus putei DSM 12395]